MTNIEIRPFTPADIDAAIAVASALPGAPHWPGASYAAALAPAPRHAALVAEDSSGQLAGFAFAAVVPPQAELESIAIAAPFQRRGLARQLMAALIEQARNLGCEQMLLEVRESNTPARRLYASLGFRQSG